MNPHGYPRDPKSRASASSATLARNRFRHIPSTLKGGSLPLNPQGKRNPSTQPSLSIIKRPSPSGHPKIQVTKIVLPEAPQLQSELIGGKYAKMNDSIDPPDPVGGFISTLSSHNATR